MQKKQRLFNAAKRTHQTARWDRYRAQKKDTLKSIRRFRWSYINDILQFGLDNNDLKPFWCYVRSQRQDSLGISALREGGTLYSHVKTKAEILSGQFCSVFKREDQQEVTKLYGPSYLSIDPIEINERGVLNLLTGLNVSKASDPDLFPCKILKGLASELAPILTRIFRLTTDLLQVPSLVCRLKHTWHRVSRRAAIDILRTIDRLP